MKHEVVKFNDRLSFTIIEMTEQKVLRVWYDKADDMYCYQYFDFTNDDDDTPEELSGRYVDDRIRVETAAEYVHAFNGTVDDLSINGKTPLYVFYNDNNSECVYIGVYNDDDTYSVIGAKYDSVIGSGAAGISDMFSMLLND